MSRWHDLAVRTPASFRKSDQGSMVKHRDHWTITSIHNDDTITLTGPTGTIRLPADYVAEHVELGYAQTSHAAFGSG